MNFLPVDSIFNLTVLLVFLFVLLGFAWLLISIHTFLSKWLCLLEESEISGADEIKQEAYEQATEILDKARGDSIRIITESNAKTKMILDSITELTSDSKNQLENTLKNLSTKHAEILNTTSNELLTHYKQLVNLQKNESLHAITDATKTIKKELVQDMADFHETVEKETLEGQKLVEKKLTEEFAQVEKEIQEFKKERLEQATREIYDILRRVSLEVFGKALSLADHEELVVMSLEKAKKEKLFIQQII